jgi:ankyrin repeat protein
MIRTLASLAIVAAALAGCAQIPTGTFDDERLHHAIAMDDVGLLEGAVKSGRLHVNQNISAPGFREGAPLVLISARHASLKTLRYLIAAGANINARAATGETALMLASYFASDDYLRSASSSERYEQAVRMLVEAGASLENAPNHYTPLGYAAYQGHERIVRYLLERGARPDGDAQDGITYVNTPLMMAAIQGHRDTAMWLLRAGADARVRIYLGNTAAELAQRNKHVELAGTLKCAEGLAPGERFAQKCAGR